MRQKTDLFLIDGMPMYVPDGDMGVSFEDLDASDSGRDEAGVMHRIVVRYGVGKWAFSYHAITQEEFAYMEQLFQNKDSFQFTYPCMTDCSKAETVTAYRSKAEIVWRSAKTGDLRNYNFSIIAC